VAGELARVAADGTHRAQLDGRVVSLDTLEVIAYLAAEGRRADVPRPVWLTVAEAARILAVTPRQVRRRAAAGQLPARQDERGRRWLVVVQPDRLIGRSTRPDPSP
jgi:excisionase family DNA binding protein